MERALVSTGRKRRVIRQRRWRETRPHHNFGVFAIEVLQHPVRGTAWSLRLALIEVDDPRSTTPGVWIPDSDVTLRYPVRETI